MAIPISLRGSYRFNPVDSFGDISRSENAKRQADEQQSRMKAAKVKSQPLEQGQHTASSGVMTPRSIDQAPAWKGQIERRSKIDPFASNHGAPSGESTSQDSSTAAPATSPANRDGFARTQGDIDAGFQNLPSIDNAAPRMDPGWQLKGTGREGVVIPDTARNYKGEKSYLDPLAGGKVYDVDPSKDQRFSVNGQTSGANTAAGIAAKYGVPGTTASFTPAQPEQSAPVAQTGPPQTPDRAALYQNHPEVFQAGTPQNIAFVNHVKDYGEDSAHQNIDGLMEAAGTQLTPPASTPTPAAAPTPIAANPAPSPTPAAPVTPPAPAPAQATPGAGVTKAIGGNPTIANAAKKIAPFVNAF